MTKPLPKVILLLIDQGYLMQQYLVCNLWNCCNEKDDDNFQLKQDFYFKPKWSHLNLISNLIVVFPIYKLDASFHHLSKLRFKYFALRFYLLYLWKLMVILFLKLWIRMLILKVMVGILSCSFVLNLQRVSLHVQISWFLEAFLLNLMLVWG